eukprot:gene14183-5188_t
MPVLCLDKSAIDAVRWCDAVAKQIKGQGDIVYINCGEDKESKKLCKKYKTSPSPLVLKHFKDGNFHKLYDRKHTAKSLLNFMRNPTGDVPWDEDATAKDVVHINTIPEFIKLRRKEKGSLLVMFYAPWCGHCKRLKPEFSAAATEVKGRATLASLDCDKPELSDIKYEFNITGYPTLIFFENGQQKFDYGGKYSKDGIVEWLEDPQPAKTEPESAEEEWKDVPSDVVHLKSDTFDTVVSNSSSVLVMFYAPWCSHCKKMKPEYIEAAKRMKDENVDGILAAVDCTKEQSLGKKYDISGFPTVKYFRDGNFHKLYDRKHTAKSLLNFMRNPTGDVPWDEDATAKDVVHINTIPEFIKLRRKEKGSLLVMFYAPWCGHCKRLKPEFSAAATEVKGRATLASLDCDKPELSDIKYEFNITGYPTLIFFENGQQKFDYGGKYSKDGIVEWLEDPQPAKTEPESAEEEWKDVPSDVVHLKSDTFDTVVSNSSSVLVMFYAPWCSHCKKMKPEYIEAAKRMKDENVDGILAAVDCTKEQSLGKKYDISGFPTVKYFSEGEFKYTVRERTADKIVDFMKDPKEPPPPPPPDQPWSETSGKEILHLDDLTFKDSLKKRKHVLVMFYAPWCGHCKKAKPEYEKAALEFVDDRKVTFAAVDCTISQATCESFDVSGYPTFKYINYGKKTLDYQSGRETNDFINFMKDPKEGPPPPPPEKEWSEHPSKIHHLSDNDFDSFMKDHNSVLVMFYAPWCGHCKAMKPAYEEAAEELQSQGASGVLAAVDCTKNSALRDKYEIKGFPTLKYFRNGESKVKYESGRTKENLVKFMLNPGKAIPPPATDWSEESKHVVFLTSNTFDEFAKDKSDMLVMFYAPWCGHCNKMKPAYFEAAKVLKEDMPDSVLAAVDCQANPDVAEKYHIKGFPTRAHFIIKSTVFLCQLILFQAVKLSIIEYLSFRNGQHAADYEGGRGIDEILDFMKRENKGKKSSPAIDKEKWSNLPSSVVHLTAENLDSALSSSEHSLVMFHTSVCQQCYKMRRDYMKAASRTVSKKFKLAALDCDDYSEYCKENKIANFPVVRYYFKGIHIEDVTIDNNPSPELFIQFLEKKSHKDEL